MAKSRSSGALGATKAPASATRSADFKNTARLIVEEDRQPFQYNLGAAIARALEAAYQRGFSEAIAGPPPESDYSDGYPWLEIPARARNLFEEWCRREVPVPSEADYTNVAFVLKPARFPSDKGGWIVLRHDRRAKQYEQSYGNQVIGVTTLKQLVDRQLIERMESGTQSFALITDYGMATYRKAQLEGHILR